MAYQALMNHIWPIPNTGKGYGGCVGIMEAYREWFCMDKQRVKPRR